MVRTAGGCAWREWRREISTASLAQLEDCRAPPIAWRWRMPKSSICRAMRSNISKSIHTRGRWWRTATVSARCGWSRPDSFINELIPKCEIVRYELRGIPLVTQGEPGDAIYIIRDGFVQVVLKRED